MNTRHRQIFAILLLAVAFLSALSSPGLGQTPRPSRFAVASVAATASARSTSSSRSKESLNASPAYDGESAESTENQDDPAYSKYKSAYNLILDEEWEEALKQFSGMVSTYPKSEYVDDARYWTAYALKHVDPRKSIEAYNRFLKDFPESRYYDDAVADISDLDGDVSAPMVVTTGAIDSLRVVALPGGKGYTYSIGQGKNLERLFRLQDRQLRQLRVRGVGPAMTLWNPVPEEEENLDPETRLKLEALEALGEMKEDEKSYRTLRGIAIDPSQPRRLRTSALEGLSHFKKHDIVAVYLDIAKHDTSEQMQNIAIECITQGGGDKSKTIGVLVQLFETIPSHREEQLQSMLYSIAEVGNEKAVEFLALVARSNKNFELRRDAVYLLGNIGGEKARAALYDILERK